MQNKSSIKVIFLNPKKVVVLRGLKPVYGFRIRDMLPQEYMAEPRDKYYIGQSNKFLITQAEYHGAFGI